MNLKKQITDNPKKIIALLLVLLLTVGIYVGYLNFISNPPYDLLLDWFERLSTYSMNSIDMEIEFLPESQTLKMNTEMTINPEIKGNRYFIFALSDELNISKASINGQSVKVWRFWIANMVYLPSEASNDQFTLELEYSGFPSGFFKKLAEEHIDEDFAYIDATNLYYPYTAGNSEKPEEIKITLISPSGINAITGGRLLKEQAKNNKVYRTWQGNQDPTQVIFGKFDKYISHEVKDVSVSIPEKHREYRTALTDAVNEIVSIYNKKLGTVEPDYLNLAILPHHYGGRFHDGMITIGENSLKYDDEGELDRDLYNLLAHEIGHFYWNSSADIAEIRGQQWYVEGFTEYASEIITAQKYGMSLYNHNLNDKIGYLKHTENQKSLLDYTYWEYSIVPYYKGNLMLEGLRRVEGSERVIRFLNAVRNNPNNYKDLDILIKAAQEVFGKDYRQYFKHWLHGVEPVVLSIEDVTWGDDEIVLTIYSNQNPGLPLDIMLYGVNKDVIIQRNISAGENRLTIENNDSKANTIYSIDLDPYRKLYRLESLFENIKTTRPLPYVDENHVPRFYEKPDNSWFNNISIKQIEELSDNWIKINREIIVNNQKWSLEKILPDYNTYWAILSCDQGELYTYPSLELELNENKKHCHWSDIVYIDDDANKILLKWDRTINNFISNEDNIIRISELGYENELEIRLPFQNIDGSAPYFPGKELTFSDYKIRINRLTIYELEASLDIIVEDIADLAEEDLVYKIMDADVYCADGNFISSGNSIWKSRENNQQIFTLEIPFLNIPTPLNIKIKGIEVKQGLHFLPDYIPGGILSVGLDKKDIGWEENSPGRIRINDHQEIYINRLINSRYDDRNISMFIGSGKSTNIEDKTLYNTLYLTVEGNPGDTVRAYLLPSSQDFGTESEDNRYFLPEKTITERNNVRIPIKAENLENGWYNVGVDIERGNRHYGGIESTNVLLIYEPEKIINQEKMIREELCELIENMKADNNDNNTNVYREDDNHNTKEKLQDYLDEYIPYWYEVLEEYADEENFEFKLEEVELSNGYPNNTIFTYRFKLIVPDENHMINICAVVDNEGILELK